MNFKYIEFILSKNDYINHVFLFVIVLFCINTFLNKIYSNNNIQSDTKKEKFSFISNVFFASIFLVSLSIIASLKPLMTFLNIISIFFLTYIFIVIPLFDIKQYNIITRQEQVSLSLFFLIYLYNLVNKNIFVFLIKINNEYFLQFATIIISITFLFCLIYVFFINIYWFLFYINELLVKKLSTMMYSILDKYSAREKLNSLIEETKKDYRCNIKNLKYLLGLILKIIVLLLLEFGFFTIIRFGIVFVECMLKITNNPDYIIYKLSKLSVLLSMFTTYITIQINGTFSPNIIDIFELVITSTIIPIVIEKLINNSLTKKQESNVS